MTVVAVSLTLDLVPFNLSPKARSKPVGSASYGRDVVGKAHLILHAEFSGDSADVHVESAGNAPVGGIRHDKIIGLVKISKIILPFHTYGKPFRHINSGAKEYVRHPAVALHRVGYHTCVRYDRRIGDL